MPTIRFTLNEICLRLTRIERHFRRRPRLGPFRRLADARDILLNGKKLGAAMGVSASFILAMKRAGYRFTNGHQTTLDSALTWRAAFPAFRTHRYLSKGWRTLPRFRLIQHEAPETPPAESSANPASEPRPV